MKPHPSMLVFAAARFANVSRNAMRRRASRWLLIALLFACTTIGASSTIQAQRGVYKATVKPHWIDDGHFWYRNDLPDRRRRYVLVDAPHGERRPAFDHRRLATALADSGVKNARPRRLQLDDLQFDLENQTISFRANGRHWRCRLEDYQLQRLDDSANVGDAPRSDKQPAAPGSTGNPRRRDRGGVSPNGKWRALVQDHNVVLERLDKDAKDEEGEDIQLSHDGEPSNYYDRLEWSPDSRTLVAFRVKPGDKKQVHLIESSPEGGGRAVLHSREYPLPGDNFTAYELNLFRIEDREQIKPQVEPIDFGQTRVRWRDGGRRFTYEKKDRGHQRFRVIEIDANNGAARNIIDEKSETFIFTYASAFGPLVRYLEKSEELIYASERDGWRHLYLVDVEKGEIACQITRGQWVVRGIDRIDEDKRQIWFRASGRNPEQDPYFIHYYRIDFDGSNLVALTDGDGNHTVQCSPNREYLIDTYSRVDMPPVHKLRRTCDGKLLCKLERADIRELKASGWKPPEVFTAKGRDGKTDIWGIVCRPRNFDPHKKYPVIEAIYAGPHNSYVPKSFNASRLFSSLTDLGFVVAKIDGMGTANRSKAFHDVCWHNLKDAGFPDRILWHKAFAAKNPWYDITRVGIYGGSAGGQNSTGALLFHGDFYHVAVSSCGCHDNRLDKASWNEQWMGYPVGPQYAECSNIENAHRLRGKLMLIVGELDRNVPPESTYRLADALIKAGKDFELVVIPGGGHGDGGPYGERRRQDFFLRHLLGKQPPDRNAGP